MKERGSRIGIGRSGGWGDGREERGNGEGERGNGEGG